MALVDYVDYPNRRIHLSAATVDTDLDLMVVGKEVRALRANTPAHQVFKPLVYLGGNITKIADSNGNVLKATQRYFQLINGALIAPYNGSGKLRVITECFTSDGKAGRDCFDRTTLSSTVVVDIDMAVDPVEVRYVNVGSSAAPTAAQNAEATVAAMNANPPSVNVTKVKGYTIHGEGTEANPWGP